VSEEWFDPGGGHGIEEHPVHPDLEYLCLGVPGRGDPHRLVLQDGGETTDRYLPAPGVTSAFPSRVTIALSVYTVAFTTRDEILASAGFALAVRGQIGSSVAATRRGVSIRMTMGLFSGGTNVPRNRKN